jgi:hypothetical protein
VPFAPDVPVLTGAGVAGIGMFGIFGIGAAAVGRFINDTSASGTTPPFELTMRPLRVEVCPDAITAANRRRPKAPALQRSLFI